MRFDVCESPEWNAEGLGIAMRGRIPMVVRLHSGAAQVLHYYVRTGVDSRLAVRCERALIRRADVLTGLPKLLEIVAAQSGISSDRTVPILNPVKRVAMAPPPTGPPRILFAGRVEPRKGPDVLLRAAPLVLTKRPDARFVFAGPDSPTENGGSYTAHLQELARQLGVADSIDFVGRMDGPSELAREIAASTLCAVPSRWESMPYVAAEAATLGRPVVASEIFGHEGMVEHGRTGMLAPVDDEAAWADAILSVLSLSSEERLKMGRRASEHTAARTDPESIAEATLRAYELAIERKRAS